MKAVMGHTDTGLGTSLVAGLGGSGWGGPEATWTSKP